MIKRKKITAEERLDELTRRVDTLATKLHVSDSPVALRKIPEMEKRIDAVFRHIITNENEFRIFRDIVSNLQRDFYRKKPGEK